MDKYTLKMQIKKYPNSIMDQTDILTALSLISYFQFRYPITICQVANVSDAS